MLWSFIGHGITALLRKRLLGNILGIFQPLVFHADILHKRCITPTVLCKQLFHFVNPETGCDTEFLTPRQLVEKLHGSIGITEVKFQSAGPLCVQDAVFVAFHHKAEDAAPADGADAIGVAVEIGFDGEVGIEYPCNGTQGGGRFIFRPVNNNFISLVRPRPEFVIVNPFCTGHVAADPATIGDILGEKGFPYIAADFNGIRVTSELEVVHG